MQQLTEGAPMAKPTALETGLRIAQHLRQLGEVRRYAAGLVAVSPLTVESTRVEDLALM